MSTSAAVSARREAAALVDAGSYLRAIDVLTALAGDVRDADVEVQLASLRRDAFIELEQLTEPHSAEVPADPFPLETAIPEISAGDLTAPILAGALHHHGVLMVRGLLDVAVAESLAAEVDRAFDAQQRWRDGAPSSELAPTFVPLENHERYPLRPNAALGRQWERYRRVLAVDAPHLLFELFEAWRAVGLHDLLEAHFGARPVLGENKFCVRRMPFRDGRLGGDWHQEASVFDVDQYLRAVNLWLALSPCGRDAPAIEFIPVGLDEVLETDRAYCVNEDRAAAATGDRPAVQPEFAPGDGVLFNELVLHRTYQHDQMDKVRFNVEAWFFAPWSHPGHNGRVVF